MISSSNHKVRRIYFLFPKIVWSIFFHLQGNSSIRICSSS